jgi:hypothetical protein
MDVIEISPFLHLPSEGILSDVNDSDHHWMTTSVRWCAHDDNGILEDTLDLNSVPELSLVLVDGDVTELYNSVWFQSSSSDVFAKDG